MYLLDTNICIYIIKKKPPDVLKTLKTKLKKELEKKGKIIGLRDLLLAAQVKSKKLILVTDNTKEFERVEGLKIENWLQA